MSCYFVDIGCRTFSCLVHTDYYYRYLRAATHKSIVHSLLAYYRVYILRAIRLDECSRTALCRLANCPMDSVNGPLAWLAAVGAPYSISDDLITDRSRGEKK